MRLKLGQVADWIHAEGDVATEVEATGYSIDSRSLAAGICSLRSRVSAWMDMTMLKPRLPMGRLRRL